jgi:hypothetical protein
VAIISLRELLRFIFNPFRVGALQNHYHRFHLWLLSRSASYCVSYSTPSGLVLYKTTTTGFTCGYYLAPRVTAFQIQPLWGWYFTKPLPQVSPVAIISLRELLRFRFNPFRVGALQNHYHRFHLGLLSRVASYCVSYYLAPLVTAFQPLWGWRFTKPLPQVSPGAIISLRELLRFILSRSARYCVSTPLGLALYKTTSTGSTCGYYLAPLVTAFHIQPPSGLVIFICSIW